MDIELTPHGVRFHSHMGWHWLTVEELEDLMRFARERDIDLLARRNEETREKEQEATNERTDRR